MAGMRLPYRGGTWWHEEVALEGQLSQQAPLELPEGHVGLCRALPWPVLRGSCCFAMRARKAGMSDYIFLPLYSWGYLLLKLIFVCVTRELGVCLSLFPQEDKHSPPNPSCTPACCTAAPSICICLYGNRNLCLNQRFS